MRLSDVEICNEAIGLVGSTDWIQSLTDPDSISAQRCNRYFTSAVETVLRQHDWNCATAVVALAQNATSPITEYDYSFALPYNCVRVINMYSTSECYSPYDRWRIVGRDIHTDSGTVYLKYVAFPEDYKELDILLAKAIAYELALKLAPSYMKDREVYAILEQASRRARSEAQAIDSLESKYLYVENSVWSDVRDTVGGGFNTIR